MFFRFLFGILFLSQMLFAQQMESCPKTAVALQISDISGMIKVNPLYGMVFSLKHHFSSNFAIRMGIDPTYTDIHGETISTDSLGQTTESKDYQYLKGIGANLDFLFYLKNSSKIKLILGAGPGFFINNKKEFPRKSEFKAFNLHILLGTEWLVSRHFSVGLEYGLQYEKRTNQWQEDTIFQQGNQAIPQKIRKKWEYKGLSSMPINLILSLYF